MKSWNVVAIVACVLTLTLPGAMASQPLTLGQKASLQAAMQRHIERRLVDGVYLHLDEAAGEVRELRSMAAHPMILRMGRHFVLCSDFRDASGAPVNIDFYVAEGGGGFVVFDERVDNRELVHRLMKAGKLERTE